MARLVCGRCTGLAPELAEVREGLRMFGADVPLARAEFDVLADSRSPCARRRTGAGLSPRFTSPRARGEVARRSGAKASG